MELYRHTRWTKESRIELIRTIWPKTAQDNLSSSERHYSAFYDFAISELAILEGYPTSYAFGTPNEMIRAIQHLNGGQQLTRANAARVIEDIVGHQLDDAMHERALKTMEIVIRIWLTIDVRLAKSQARGPYRTLSLEQTSFIVWRGDGSLQGAMTTYFEALKTSRSIDSQGTKIAPALSLEYLVNVHDFSINWSSNLLDHLLIDLALREVTVFEHKICLVNHLQEDEPVIPRAVLEETIDTLNFLLPFENKSTKSFLRRHKKPIYGLGRCNRDLNLDLDKYVYWRSRIEALLEVLKTPPRGFQQLRLDKSRQNLTHVLNFWIAAAVAILTIMSFVFGVISTVYSKKQYEAGILQYRLARAQACSMPDAAQQLPEFCS